MKQITTILLLMGLLLSSATEAQPEGSMEIYFPTTGNCYLCKVRIEEAVNTLTGIESVLWDAVTDVTYVTYDDTQTDAFEIMQTISSVGHETEWYPADDSAYKALENTCCYYEKVIDYSNVQPGYLSMMGIWVSPLTGIDNQAAMNFRLNMISGSGLFTINWGEILPAANLTASVYNINGQQLHLENMTSSGQIFLDLRHLRKGIYILLITGGDQVFYKTKISIY